MDMMGMMGEVWRGGLPHGSWIRTSPEMGSRLRRPLRNLPDEATSGVVNDTILAKAPPQLLDTGLRRYDGCAKVSLDGNDGGVVESALTLTPALSHRWRGGSQATPSPRPSPAGGGERGKEARPRFLRPTAREGGFETRPYSTTRGGGGGKRPSRVSASDGQGRRV